MISKVNAFFESYNCPMEGTLAEVYYYTWDTTNLSPTSENKGARHHRGVAILLSNKKCITMEITGGASKSQYVKSDPDFENSIIISSPKNQMRIICGEHPDVGRYHFCGTMNEYDFTSLANNLVSYVLNIKYVKIGENCQDFTNQVISDCKLSPPTTTVQSTAGCAIIGGFLGGPFGFFIGALIGSSH
jgi:hypothetical protein